MIEFILLILAGSFSVTLTLVLLHVIILIDETKKGKNND
jgi:hypothetical protein